MLSGVLAYALWGILPAYWKQLSSVDAVELVVHRVVWGFGVFLLIVFATDEVAALRVALRDVRLLALLALSSLLLAINWGMFVWASINGHLLDASLGYFINPLFSVALGTLVLRERLRPLQKVAIGVATVGVALLAWRAGHVPWIALALAGTFASYGLVRKTANANALVGSTIETAIMAPVAIIYLCVIAERSGGAITHGGPSTIVLLVGTGIVTAVPLLLFTKAARSLPLSTVGFLQFLAPTCQFLLAVIVYNEPIDRLRFASFAPIWMGLILFSIDLWLAARVRVGVPGTAEVPARASSRRKLWYVSFTKAPVFLAWQRKSDVTQTSSDVTRAPASGELKPPSDTRSRGDTTN